MATRYDFSKKRPTKSTSSSGRWKWVAVVVGFLVVSGSTVWGAKYLWAARQVAAVRAASAELFSEETRNLPEAERREKFNALREQYEALPESAQDQLRDERRKRFEEREDQQLTEFFAKSPVERKAALDERIDREEERRKEWEKRRAERERERAARGETDREGNRGDGDRGGRGPGGPGGSGPGGSARPGGGPPGGGGGGPGGASSDRGRGGGGPGGYRDPQRRNEWRKRRLDESTPQGRAMRAEYRRLMDERRAARGLPASSGRGRG